MQTTMEQVKTRDYERFEANRRFEEMTDIAERLGYPINITIPYELRGDALYARTDTVSRPFHNQTLLALQRGQTRFIGDQAFERTRLAHEHDEALLADQLAMGKLSGNVLIKLSKVPDAVVEGRTSINGYRRDLLRSFVRVYYRAPEGVECRLFTLDHNDELGMKKVGELLGIDTNRGSEEILADYSLLHVPSDIDTFVDELTRQTIQTYDEAIRTKSGGETYAGSVYSGKQDAMAAISSQAVLVEQHMASIAQIVAAGLSEAHLEAERERTAAAIKLANEGYQIGSNADASVTSEVASGNYGGECATASTTGMNQAANMENVWTQGECQVCFARTRVGSCMVCASCAAADDRGVDLLKLRERKLNRRRQQQQLSAHSIEHTYPKNKTFQTIKAKHDSIRKQYGTHAVLKREIVIGGTREVVRDRYTNIVLSA